MCILFNIIIADARNHEPEIDNKVPATKMEYVKFLYNFPMLPQFCP
jgi:hypothetical protein